MKTQILFFILLINLNSKILSSQPTPDIVKLAVFFNFFDSIKDQNKELLKEEKVKPQEKISRKRLSRQNNFKDKSFKKF